MIGVKDLSDSLRRSISSYLIDPLRFPPEFVSWVRKMAHLEVEDLQIGPIDSTENVGLPWGVQSVDSVDGPETAGLVLTAIGDGGSIWAPALGASQSAEDFVRNHPCGVSFWPFDDVGPGVADPIAGNDLIECPASGFAFDYAPPVGSMGSYAFIYRQTGPSTATKSIHFDGADSGFHTYGATMYRNGLLSPGWPGSYTIGGWVNSDVSNIFLRYPLTIWGGGTTQTSLHPSGFSIVTTAGTYSVLNGATFDATDWHHIMGSYNASTSTMKMYFDGALVGTTSPTSGAPDGAGYLRFSGAGNSAAVTYTNHWQGYMSSWALFNCAIDDEDVATLYGLLGAPVGAGTVPTADGSGGFTFEYPTIGVTY